MFSMVLIALNSLSEPVFIAIATLYRFTTANPAFLLADMLCRIEHTEKKHKQTKTSQSFACMSSWLLEFYKRREGSLLISTTTHDLYHFNTEVCF